MGHGELEGLLGLCDWIDWMGVGWRLKERTEVVLERRGGRYQG